MREELDEFPSPVPRLTFGDVGWNRNNCASHLGRQAEPLIAREGTCHCVNLLCQGHALLPDKKIPITPDLTVSSHIVPLRIKVLQ